MLCIYQSKSLDLCFETFVFGKKFVICTRFREDDHQGEMLEWLKRHAWKACIRLKRIAGSNPTLSASRRR